MLKDGIFSLILLTTNKNLTHQQIGKKIQSFQVNDLKIQLQVLFA